MARVSRFHRETASPKEFEILDARFRMTGTSIFDIRNSIFIIRPLVSWGPDRPAGKLPKRCFGNLMSRYPDNLIPFPLLYPVFYPCCVSYILYHILRRKSRGKPSLSRGCRPRMGEGERRRPGETVNSRTQTPFNADRMRTMEGSEL